MITEIGKEAMIEVKGNIQKGKVHFATHWRPNDVLHRELKQGERTAVWVVWKEDKIKFLNYSTFSLNVLKLMLNRINQIIKMSVTLNKRALRV